MSSRRPPHETFRIGWICALPIEGAAAKEMLDENFGTLEEQNSADTNSYILGRIGRHNIVIACLPNRQYGPISATAVAINMMRTFSESLRIGLLVGIGGGVPSNDHDVRLGDIVISHPKGSCGGVIQHDMGKIEKGGSFHRTGSLNRPPTLLLTAVSNMRASWTDGPRYPEYLEQALRRTGAAHEDFARPDPQSDKLFKPEYEHPPTARTCDGCLREWEVYREERENNRPQIHYGIIASGNSVIKHGATRDKLYRETGALCLEMEAAGLMSDFPCIVVRGISDYADSHKNDKWQAFAALAAASYVKELLNYIPQSHLPQQRLATEICRKVDDLKRRVSVFEQRLHLGTLQIASGAAFDSIENQHSECLEGTRTELLRQIEEWTRSPNGKCIFWLNGMAGTGKSTISRTIASRLRATKSLGASFFFKRGEADRGNAKKLFPTLIDQLVTTIPPLLPATEKAIEENPNVSERMLTAQFEKLMLEPLSAMTIRLTNPMVVVIDALDECDNDDEIRGILQLLPRVQAAGTIQLRFLLSSRPELPIRLGMKSIADHHQDLILHEIPEPVIEHDLTLYYLDQFSEIRQERQLSLEWPGEETLRTLVKRAAPLFISAATLCRFISDKRWNPQERLQVIISDKTAYLTKMASIYMPVLSRLLVGQDEREAQQLVRDFKEIVGMIILLVAPLSIHALSRLLKHSAENIACRVRLLHSVIDVPSEGSDHTVRILHESFRDFLLDPRQKEDNPFWIDGQELHQVITLRCLNVMSSLKKNILHLLPGQDIQRQEIIKDALYCRYLPPELQYACRYWTKHLSQTQDPVNVKKDIMDFLQVHFLHWVEAMSLLGFASDIGGMIDVVQSVTNNHNSEFLHHAKRFFWKNRQIIDNAPLQLYCSGLLFSPRMASTWKVFKKELPNWIEILPAVGDSWSAELQTLVGHSEGVQTVAFSPDGRLLASGSNDKTARLWDPINGILRSTLKGHSGSVQCITFSPNNRLLASGSDDNTVRLWDLTTGTLSSTLRGHLGPVRSVAFSYDDQVLASGSDDTTVRLWDSVTGNLRQTLRYHLAPVLSVAFSPNSLLLASGSNDEKIQLWNITTRRVQTVGYHLGSIMSLAFSSNGRLLTSSSYYPMARTSSPHIRHWDLHQGKLQRVTSFFRGSEQDPTDTCLQEFRSLAFFLDMSLIAFNWNDEQIRLADLSTDEGGDVLKGHLDPVRSVGFSPDGRLLASASDDKTVRLWDLTSTGTRCDTQHNHACSVLFLKFSLDGRVVASGSDYDTIRLWDPETGVLKSTIRDRFNSAASVALSPDGRILAFGSGSVIEVQDTTTGAHKMTLIDKRPGFRFARVGSVTFSTDSRTLASAAGDRRIRLWNVDAGTRQGIFSFLFLSDPSVLQTLEGHPREICSVAFSPDGRLIASGSSDSTIRLWDSATTTVERTLRGHSGPAVAVAFSPDSELLASASSDETIRLWDPTTGALRQTLSFTGSVHTLHFSQDGSHLNTNLGSINIQSSCYSHCSNPSRARFNMFLENQWVWIGDSRVLWIPPDHWPSMSAVQGKVLALAYRSGQVSFIGFDSEVAPRGV